MTIAVFDTNLVVDALNGVEAADAEYQHYDQVCTVWSLRDKPPLSAIASPVR